MGSGLNDLCEECQGRSGAPVGRDPRNECGGAVRRVPYRTLADWSSGKSVSAPKRTVSGHRWSAAAERLKNASMAPLRPPQLAFRVKLLWPICCLINRQTPRDSAKADGESRGVGLASFFRSNEQGYRIALTAGIAARRSCLRLRRRHLAAEALAARGARNGLLHHRSRRARLAQRRLSGENQRGLAARTRQRHSVGNGIPLHITCPSHAGLGK